MSRLKVNERIVKGRLTQVGQPFRVATKGENITCAVFECVCGNRIVTAVFEVKRGSSTSCGCLAQEILVARSTTHGLMTTKLGRKTHRAWNAMMNRCYNKHVEGYENYGGRGIQVCNRWHKVEYFLDDMGISPDGLTLERIDVNGNYEPSNCKWASTLDQARNRRNNILITIGTETKCMSEWAMINKLPLSTVFNRLRRGWSGPDAVTLPSRRKG